MSARCWSCKKPYTEAQREQADGDCPHCGVEIDAAQPEAKAAPSALFDRKLADLEQRGYEVIGRILHKDGQYALFDSSCRWLTRPQYQRLMHEQDGSLFAAPAQIRGLRRQVFEHQVQLDALKVLPNHATAPVSQPADRAAQERDMLAKGIGDALLKVQIWNGEVPLSGPHLLMMLNDLAELVSQPAAQEWLTSAAPEDGRGFYAYHPSLVHPDFNPWGVVEAVCNGNAFIGAVWDGQHDCWNTVEIQVAAWKPISGPHLPAPLSAPAGGEQPQ